MFENTLKCQCTDQSIVNFPIVLDTAVHVGHFNLETLPIANSNIEKKPYS